jgi:hypothetical protein
VSQGTSSTARCRVVFFPVLWQAPHEVFSLTYP